MKNLILRLIDKIPPMVQYHYVSSYRWNLPVLLDHPILFAPFREGDCSIERELIYVPKPIGRSLRPGEMPTDTKEYPSMKEE